MRRLAYLMRISFIVATVHALTILALGLWFILRDKQPFRLIYLTGYIAGADVLWRMTKAAVFWEFSKYLLCLLFILGMLKWRGRAPVPPPSLWHSPAPFGILYRVGVHSLWAVKSRYKL